MSKGFGVPINPEGACLQLGGDGQIRPVGQTSEHFGTSANPAASVVVKAAPAMPEVSAPPTPSPDAGKRNPLTYDFQTRTSPLALDAVSPRGVVKAAKARVRAIRAELRNMKALQKELAELERLIQAAKKPLAAVRDIRRSAG